MLEVVDRAGASDENSPHLRSQKPMPTYTAESHEHIPYWVQRPFLARNLGLKFMNEVKIY